MTTPTFYNTLTRQKEPFEPIDRNDVRMYVCGPTVYDFAHIGNARPVIVFDVLYRLLRHLYGEDKVTYVRNITDVDDKINARAVRDYPDLPLNEAIRKVTEKTATQFHEDVKALGCLEPTFEPRATEHIDGMIAIAQTLLDKGHAYIAKGPDGREALFDVRSMEKYGRLSNRKLDDQQAGARIEVKSHKRNPGDFVLWKESNENEPGWTAEFIVSEQNMNDLGSNSKAVTIYGRPGWHIECSAMSKALLGEHFDIHGGGLDLIFPHHENEIAQSCCASSTDKMANVWMHNGYLQVEGKKMSKSDGNFVTIHDLLHTEKFGGRKWPGEVLRLAMLMTHYREPIDFSVKRLEEAELLYLNWNIAASDIMSDLDEGGVLTSVVANDLFADLNFSVARVALNKASETLDKTVLAELKFALNFLGVLELDEKKVSFFKEMRSVGKKSRARAFQQFLIDPNSATDSDLIDKVEHSVSQRLAFLKDKNWAEADRIRDELLAQGIQLKDGKDPETGERVTTWEVVR